MRGVTRTMLGAVLTLLAGALPLPAQDSVRTAGRGDTAERAQLERQLRQRVSHAVQARLQLTDAQMARLQQTNRTFEGRRRKLVAEERQLRLSIAQQVAAGDSADQKSVARSIDRAIAIQRARLDLVEQEQHELASFLTPVQRARYLDLQERLRRRIEELRRGQQRRGGGRPGFPAGP